MVRAVHSVRDVHSRPLRKVKSFERNVNHSPLHEMRNGPGLGMAVNKAVSHISTYIFETVFKLSKDVSDQDVVFINLPEKTTNHYSICLHETICKRKETKVVH